MNPLRALAALWDRPAWAFGEIVRRPRTWWFPITLIVISLAALSWVSAPAQVALANEQAAEVLQRLASSMNAEQAAALQQQGTQMMTVRRFMLSAVGLGGLGLFLGLVIRAGFLHLSGLALGAKSAWETMFAVAAWAATPLLWRNLLHGVLTLLGRGAVSHAGLSFLVASGDWLADGRNPLYALLGQVDLFVLWHLVLLWIGVSVATGMRRRTVGVLVVVWWLLSLAVNLIPVLVGSAVASRYLG